MSTRVILAFVRNGIRTGKGNRPLGPSKLRASYPISAGDALDYGQQNAYSGICDIRMFDEN